MANIILRLGSAGPTIVLFVGAMLLAIDGNDAWGKFFAIGVYLATWRTVYGVTGRVASLLIDYPGDRDAPVMILLAYGAGFVLSAIITWQVASRLIRFLGVPI